MVYLINSLGKLLQVCSGIYLDPKSVARVSLKQLFEDIKQIFRAIRGSLVSRYVPTF